MIDIRSYMIRAWRDWILDNGLTPYVVVDCKFPGTQIPLEHQNQKTLTLNISHSATKKFRLNQDSLSFEANFNQSLNQIHLPILAIIGIYARENNHGMWFNIESKQYQKETSNDDGFTLSD